MYVSNTFPALGLLVKGKYICDVARPASLASVGPHHFTCLVFSVPLSLSSSLCYETFLFQAKGLKISQNNLNFPSLPVSLFSSFFLAELAACRSFQARDQALARAVTQAAAVTTRDP